MSDSSSEALVSTEWLATRLGDPSLRILDGSYLITRMGRDDRTAYDAAHIPGAQFFDIDEIADEGSSLPHMLPSADKFASSVGKMGISNEHRVIVYDQTGLFSAARVWWTFRVFGHKAVAVLDGGLPKWISEGHPMESDSPAPEACQFTARHDPAMVCDAARMVKAMTDGKRIVDARAPGRFQGEEAEPRPGLRAGHIPGSVNVHYRTLLNDDQTMKPPEALREIFEVAGANPTEPILTTCGSGVTAAILSLALHRLGHTDNALYDGSWVEWGASPDLPVKTGA